MTEAKKPPAKKTAAKKTAATKAPDAAFSDAPEPKQQSLGDVADSGLSVVPEPEGPAQGAFEDTDYTKVTFVGTNYQTLDYTPRIGDEVEFLVKGRIVEVGDRALKNGFTQHFGKCDVSAVVKQE